MHRKMVKSGLISGGLAGYENLAGFRPGAGPGPDMISGATLLNYKFSLKRFVCCQFLDKISCDVTRKTVKGNMQKVVYMHWRHVSGVRGGGYALIAIIIITTIIEVPSHINEQFLPATYLLIFDCTHPDIMEIQSFLPTWQWHRYRTGD